jgi:hypothetical protein
MTLDWRSVGGELEARHGDWLAQVWWAVEDGEWGWWVAHDETCAGDTGNAPTCEAAQAAAAKAIEELTFSRPS